MTDTSSSPLGRLRALVPGPLRRALRRATEVPSRLGHAARRRAAVTQLTAAAPLREILVLCHGNICRSPFVAQRLAAARPELRVRSAGFLRGGRPSPVEALDAARRRGVDLDGHRSVQADAAMLEAAELIVVMEPGQRTRIATLAPGALSRVLFLGDLDPAGYQTRTIPDPWGHPPEVFDDCYARLDRCTAELVRRLAGTDGRG